MKKKMIPLTKEKKKIHREQKVCYICKKRFSTDDDNKEYFKVKDHCHYTGKYRSAAHDICNLRCRIPKGIPVIFHNGFTYDYHFIIKELAEESEGQFECLGENTEKYITSSVPIKKELDNGQSITDKIKFIDSFRFMSSSLSNLVDNLSEGFHCDKCIDCRSCLEYMSVNDDQLIFRCFVCKTNYNTDFNKELIKRFANIYEFCNEDINTFILLLKKVFILINTWIVGKDLMKHHFHIKNLFIGAYIWKILQMLIIDMQNESSKTLIIKI